MVDWNNYQIENSSVKDDVAMEITKKDVGKFVELPAKPEWGLGVIGKMDLRFAYILFDKSGDELNKKYYLNDNPLKLAASQSEPALAKRARVKNRKIKPEVVIHRPI
jgi:hypothetical protein